VTEPLDQVSSWLSLAEVSSALGVSPGKVKRLIEEHHLIGVRRDGEIKVPAEIIIDGEPLHSLRGTILVLIDSGFTVESAINWLYTVEDSMKVTPMQSLLAGRKAEVRRIAQSLAL